MTTSPTFETNLTTGPRRPLRLDRGETVRLVDEELGGARNIDIHLNYLHAGSGPGPRHYHERAENVYIVISGTIEVEVDGEIKTLEAEDVLFIAPKALHSTSNPGSDTAVFLEVYAPAGKDFHIVDEEKVD